MANYKVGDVVKCVDAVDELVAGRNYVIAAIHACKGSEFARPAGLKNSGACSICGGPYGNGWYSWRFIKLDGLKEDQSETTERIHEQAL